MKLSEEEMSKISRLIKNPDEINHDENFVMFWQFIHERHEIYMRRFVEKLDPPWTFDRILRTYKFTNVYRELDKGTQYYLKHVNNDHPYFFHTKLKHVLYPTIAYRMLNRVETFERIGYIPTHDMYNDFIQRKQIRTDLEGLVAKGYAVFTSAHSLPPAPKGGTKIDYYMMLLKDISKWFDTVYDQILNANGLKEVWEILQIIPKIGPFYAYEIACDLILQKAIPFSEDDWANAGPGAKQGIDLLFKGKKSLELYENYIAVLWNNQEREFDRLAIKFRGTKNPGYRLTMRSIEHSLCEFSKYWKVSRGLGRARIHFKQTSDNTMYE